jgi:hypothetical protein
VVRPTLELVPTPAAPGSACLDTRGDNIVMNRSFRLLAVVAFVLFAVPVLMPESASAQYREFTGRIDKISTKKLIVDNRKGDKVSFVPTPDSEITVQEGAELKDKKEAWDDLKKGDWVKVSWKFVDKPRKAYKVMVLPPREDDD